MHGEWLCSCTKVTIAWQRQETLLLWDLMGCGWKAIRRLQIPILLPFVSRMKSHSPFSTFFKNTNIKIV